MKISKARLQQIIKEEVEAHLRRENAAIDIDEGELKNLVSEMKKGKKEDLSLSDKKAYEQSPEDYDIVVSPSDGKTRLSKKGIEDPNVDYMKRDRFDENMEEGLEGVISLIKDRGAEGAVKALKGKKEIDNPWALVNAALTKMGRKGLSRSDESAETSEDQLFTKKRDPQTGEREKVAPKKNGIRVELKTC